MNHRTDEEIIGNAREYLRRRKDLRATPEDHGLVRAIGTGAVVRHNGQNIIGFDLHNFEVLSSKILIEAECSPFDWDVLGASPHSFSIQKMGRSKFILGFEDYGRAVVALELLKEDPFPFSEILMSVRSDE